MFPTAEFTVAKSGMSVDFTDASVGTPTSWQWDFGDGGSSIEQNPTYLFTAKQFYLVTLTVTVDAVGSDAVTHMLDMTGKPQMTGTIDEFITIEAGSLAAAITPEFRTMHIQMWQLFLQYGIEPAMPDDDVFNEAAWPSMWRLLIAKLVVYSYFLALLKGSLAGGLGATSEGGSTGTGALKKVTTGPADAEFYNAAESFTKVTQSGTDGKGLFNTVSNEICILGNFLQVKLPMCEAKILIGPLLNAGGIPIRWGYSVSTNAWYRYECYYPKTFSGCIL